MDIWPLGDFLGVGKIARLGAYAVQDPVKHAEVALPCSQQQPGR